MLKDEPLLTNMNACANVQLDRNKMWAMATDNEVIAIMVITSTTRHDVLNRWSAIYDPSIWVRGAGDGLIK